MKKLAAIILIAAFICGIFPAAASAQAGTLTVSCNISGADVYIDGTLAGVTPFAANVSEAAHTVSVSLPGYATYTDTLTGAATVSATLTPELFPADAAENVKYVTVTDAYSLETAVNDVMNDATDAWYVINFAEGMTQAYIYDESLALEKRGRFTINGEGHVQIARNSESWRCALNILVSDVRIIGLSFNAANNTQNALGLRPPNDNSQKYDVKNVYILDCSFTDCSGTGVSPCGAYGNAGVSYGGDRTASFANLVYAGNSFTRTGCFSFVGAGDEDYNKLDGYLLCGNTFVDGGIGMLAGDAHTWYVFGVAQDGEGGYPNIAYCEYNILRNVLISGNSFTMTESAKQTYENIISISCANLGNSNNLTENVEIRHNVSRITGEEANMHSTVGISNVAVSDTYEEGKEYNQHITSGMEHTDNNILRNVSVHHNDFQLGSEREFQVYNVKTEVGEQCGKNNAMYNINIYNNKINSPCGARISNYFGNTDSGECKDNSLTNVTFSNNEVFSNVTNLFDAGILVCASYISQHGHVLDDYPLYSGTMSDIHILSNDVSGFPNGIIVSGAAGDYAKGMALWDVEVLNNTISTKNWNSWPIVDIGIAVTGACMPTPGEGANTHLGDMNCSLSGVTVSGNSITARTGIAVCGFLAGEAPSHPWTGNSVHAATVSDNIIYQRAFTDGNDQKTAGIVTADIIELWYKLGYSQKDTLEMLAGNRISGVEVCTNTIGAEFETPTALYGGYAPSQISQEWTWLDETPYDSSVNGEYAAKLAINDLWIYKTFTVKPLSGRGDVNDDGSVTVLDALIICQYKLGRVTLSPEALERADVNVDLCVDMLDAYLICAYMAGSASALG